MYTKYLNYLTHFYKMYSLENILKFILQYTYIYIQINLSYITIKLLRHNKRYIFYKKYIFTIHIFSFKKGTLFRFKNISVFLNTSYLITNNERNNSSASLIPVNKCHFAKNFGVCIENCLQNECQINKTVHFQEHVESRRSRQC